MPPIASPDDFGLSEDEVASFVANGFVGPFDLYPADQAPHLWDRAKIEMALSAHPPHRSEVINYDRHLDCDTLSAHVARPEIVGRIRSLLGRDVLCWKTNIFKKEPGEAGTGWHQVSTFSVGETTEDARPSLDLSAATTEVVLELSVWTAFSPARAENGCLTFLPGTQNTWYYDESRPLRRDVESRSHDFFGYDYAENKLDPDWNPDEQHVAEMEMDAGQFVIFVERCVHGSRPNTSDRNRLGLASRYVAPSVPVYAGMDSLTEFGDTIDLSYFGCVLVSGRDEHGLNRLHETNFNGVPFLPPAGVRR